MPASRSDRESGVTPVIGTILVLAITVIGIMTAMLFGAPVIQRVQDQAATEEMVGQLRNVQHASQLLALPQSSRITGVSIAGGSLLLGEGSHVLVVALTSDAAIGCTQSFSAWSDFDAGNQMTVSGSCILPGSLRDCATATAVQPCIDVRLPIASGSADDSVTMVQSYDNGAGALVLKTGGNYTPRYVPNKPPVPYPGLVDSEDYHIVLKDASPTRKIVVDAWLLHTDRLHWERGSGAVDLDAGLLVSTEASQVFRVAGPRVDEGVNSAGAPTDLKFSLPTFHAVAYGVIAGSGDHVVSTGLDVRRVHEASVRLVRIDIAGDLAEPWCNSLLLRNQFANLPSGTYVQVTGRECSASPPDGVLAVTYAPAATPFQFTFGQAVIDVELQV